MIPMVMRLKAMELKEGRKRGLNLWIPLFLVWILLSPLFLIGLVVWLILRLLGLVLDGPRNVACLLEAGIDVLRKIDGMQIDVCNRDSHFILHF